MVSFPARRAIADAHVENSSLYEPPIRKMKGVFSYGRRLRANVRTILVTGANRGIGFATAKELALRGHRVLTTSRDERAARTAAERIQTEVEGALVEAGLLDLASFESIRSFAAGMAADIRFDCNIHNAGVLIAAPERRLTEDGINEIVVRGSGEGLENTLMMSFKPIQGSLAEISFQMTG